MIYWQGARATLHQGHALDELREIPAGSIHCCVTSPPYYGLRRYETEPVTWSDGWRGELGLEPTLDLFIEHQIAIFEEVRRVLHPSGAAWVNMGDSWACKPNGRSAAATKAAGNDDRAFRDKPDVRRHVVGWHDEPTAGWRGSKPGGGIKEKDIVGQAWALAFALRDAG